MSGRIILMRHGQTNANQRRILDTRPPGAELTDHGRQQALAAGQRIKEIAPDLGQVVSSIAIRAQQTALLAMSAFDGHTHGVAGVDILSIPVQVRTGIHEISVGDMEGRADEGAHAAYRDTVLRWQQGDFSAAFTGGEGPQDLLARAVPVVESLVGDRDSLIVSHGATIRILGLNAATIPEEIRSRRIENCGLVILEPTGPFGSWRCTHWSGVDL